MTREREIRKKWDIHAKIGGERERYELKKIYERSKRERYKVREEIWRERERWTTWKRGGCEKIDTKKKQQKKARHTWERERERKVWREKDIETD